jgi:hypothetical protein
MSPAHRGLLRYYEAPVRETNVSRPTKMQRGSGGSLDCEKSAAEALAFREEDRVACAFA